MLRKWCHKSILYLAYSFTLFPSALSIHQLAAQGEVSQVAAHLSKGEESRSHCQRTSSIITQCSCCTASNCTKSLLKGRELSLQTVHCSADRMNGALHLSCGQQRLERKLWWIFSWKRSETHDCCPERHAHGVKTNFTISQMGFMGFLF